MCDHKWPCVLCGEPTADERDWPCASCLATELALEEDFAAEPDPDIEREIRRMDELTTDERSDYENWNDELQDAT